MKYTTDRRIHLAIAAFAALVLAAGGVFLLFMRQWLGWILLTTGLLLGCVLKLATEKKTSHSEEQKGKEGRVGFVVTCGNSPHSLDFLKEIFHLVS